MVFNPKSKIENPKWAGIVALVITFAMCGVEVRAQQPKKVHRIGYLSTRDPTSESTRTEAVRQGLRELGYTEGHNITIEYRYADGNRERFSELAAELVRLKVDIILAAGGDLLIREVISATKTIPILMMGGGADPVGLGLIKSLAHPGGNVTGLTNLTRDLGGKRLELLKEAAPKLNHVAVLYDAAGEREVKEVLPVAGRTLKLAIQAWEVKEVDDFAKIFAALGKQRPDGLYVPGGAFLNTNRKRLVGFASKGRLPAVYGRSEYVTEGGLMYYGADEADSYRRVAIYVDKILKGAKPADLPVEQPTKFELIMNLKAAKQIGLTIPQRVLARADRVIK